MKRNILAVIGLMLIMPGAGANSELLGQQLEMLKNMGVEAPELEKTMRSMKKDFEEEEQSKPAAAVKPNYYERIQRSSLAKCNTGEVQLDTICQASMIRYQAYLMAVSKNAAPKDVDAYYDQHVMAAEHYVEAHKAIAR